MRQVWLEWAVVLSMAVFGIAGTVRLALEWRGGETQVRSDEERKGLSRT